MKKILMFLAAAAGALFFTLCASADTYCDVDGNGKIEAADARLALRAAVGLDELDPWSENYYDADFDGNGRIEAADARGILRVAVGLEPEGLILTAREHVDLLPGGTALITVLVRNGFIPYASTESEALRIETTHSEDGLAILFVSGYAPCENAAVTVGAVDYPGQEHTVTVTVAKNESLFLNMVGLEFLPDFGAMTGLAPEQTISCIEGFGEVEFRYQPELCAEDAEQVFYAYADLLEQLGYAYTGTEEGSDYRQIYRFEQPELGVSLKYMEDWSDEYGEPVVQSVWIVVRDENQTA